MSDPNWFLEDLTDDEGNHRLSFTIDLDSDYLEGEDPTVANWLRVLVATALYVIENEHELSEEEIVPGEFYG